jgi:hypothetical protein
MKILKKQFFGSNIKYFQDKALQNNKFFNLNIQKKNFFFIFSKLKSKNNSLIPHPEFGGMKINEYKEFNSENLAPNENDDTYVDSSLSFISLDKNGVPIIKKTYYDSLGVKQNASPKEIKLNFLKIARKYHPDKNSKSLVKYKIN